MRALPIAALLVVAAACGTQDPDYEELEQLVIPPEFTCGEAYNAADVVRLAYGGDRYPGLDVPAGLPADVVQGGVLVGPSQRYYPCAESAEDAVAVLTDIGFERLSIREGADRVYVVEGVDPFGVPGVFSVFDCAFSGDIGQLLSGNYFSQGLRGTLAGTADAESLRSLGALAFRTGMINVRYESVGTYVENVTFLGMDPEFQDDFSRGDEDLPAIDLCAAWVQPNIWGGCDAVRIGEATLVPEPDGEPGDFSVYPIQGAPIRETVFTGFCNRDE